MALGYMETQTPIGRINVIQSPSSQQPSTSQRLSPFGPSSPTASGQQSFMQSPMVSPVIAHPSQQVWESSAANMVSVYMNKDENFAQYHELVKCLPGSPTISGLMDGDYPNLESVASTMKSVSQISNLTTIPLPTGLVEQFGHMQSNCEMGIFTEIKRCWLTIDSNIFLWNYDNSSDVAYYDGLTETILGVGLIKPKKGIFKEYIKYLLCLTTSVEVVILGVTFTEEEVPGTTTGNIRPSEVMISDLLLIPEAMFNIPTDNVVMNVIAGSCDGRVFLGTKSGHVYEIIYNSNDSWFSSKCYKVNHSASTLSALIPSFLSMSSEDPIVQIEIDDTRHILYTRTESGTIEVFDLGHDGSSMASVTSRTLSSIVSSASVIARTIDTCHFKPIVSINVIEESESSVITLMAVTESGVRLFFATNHSDYPRMDSQRPTTLQLVHIRLPPGFSSASSGIGKPSRVHLTSYKRGTTLFVSIQNEDQDNLWLLNNDTFSFFPDLLEVSSVVNLNSRVWKLVEERRPKLVQQLVHRNIISGSSTSAIKLEPPLLVTQDMEEQRKFVLLSSNGVHIVYKPRPVDHLRQVLIDNQGVDNEAVKGFFQLFRDLQASVICLSLACSSVSPTDKQVADWATLAFFKYSSDVSPLSTSPQQTMQHQQQQQTMFSASQTFGSPFLSTPRPFQQNSFMASSPIASPASPMATSPSSAAGVPFIQSNMSMVQGQVIDPINEYSVRHNSLYQYFSRIVRPFWNYNVTIHSVNTTEVGTSESVTSSIPTTELVYYINKLTSLKEFMIKHISLQNNSRSQSINYSNIDPMSPVGIQLRERNSLNNLIAIINHCLESLNLWKILLDHQFHTISNILPTESINSLKSMSFKDIILSSAGHDICSNLASALIQKYIDDNSTTDAISKRLVDSCPSIFKTENALTAKAHEKIMKAKLINISSAASSAATLSSASFMSPTGTTPTAINELISERKQLIVEAFNLLKKIGERINLSQAAELLLQVNAIEQLIELCLKAANDRDPQLIGINFYKSNHNNVIYMNNPDTISSNEYHRGLSLYQIRMDCYNILMAAFDKLNSKCDMTVVQPSSSPNKTSPSVPRHGEGVNACLMLKNFDELTKDEAEELSSYFINYFTSKSTNDELSHVALYDYLFHHKKHDKLLSIKSTFLEEYLKRKTTQLAASQDTNYDPIKLMDLLWMFYERNGHYRAAAEILSKLAEKSGHNLNLYQRMEYLARGIVCLQSSSNSNNLILSSKSPSNSKSTGELLHELEEKMDVAKVQLQLLDSIKNMSTSGSSTSISRHLKESMINKLNHDLLDITNCYEIAEKFNLPELQLTIVVTANHFDPGLIETFWKNILDKLLSECSDKSSDSIKHLIENKLVNLGNIYLPSDKYFPLDFIISYLESKSSQLRLPEFWLPTMLIDGLNLSLTHLLTIYHKLYRTKGPNVSWTGKDVQLLSILCHLISKFSSSPQLVPRSERRPLVTKCLDVISGYLLDLQTNHTADGKRLMQEFKVIQNQLNNYD